MNFHKVSVSKEFALHSSSASLKKNGSYLSDLYFDIRGLYRYRKSPEYLYSTVKIKTASFPNVFYNVDLHRTLSIITSNGTIVEKELRAGYYDVFSLADELNKLFKDTLIFDFDEITQLLSVKSVGDFLFSIVSSPFARQLGFENTYTLFDSVHVGTHVPDLNVECLFISFDAVFNNNLNTKTNENYFEQVPLKQAFGEVQFFSSNEKTIKSENNIDSMSIRLTDINGNLINFRGMNWQITIEITNYFKTSTDDNSPDRQLKFFLEKIFELLTTK